MEGGIIKEQEVISLQSEMSPYWIFRKSKIGLDLERYG